MSVKHKEVNYEKSDSKSEISEKENTTIANVSKLISEIIEENKSCLNPDNESIIIYNILK